MNSEQNTLQLFYYRYKNSLLYPIFLIVVLFFISFMLIFYVIMPQYQQWFSIQNEVAQTQAKIATINQNIRFASSLDKNKLDMQLQTASAALPSDKNFQAILATLSDSALNAGVQFEDYSFRIGPLAASPQDTVSTQYHVPILQMTVTIDGDLGKMQKFVETIEHRLPISVIPSLTGDARGTTLSIQFLNKPFSTITYHDEDPLTPVNKQQAKLLEDLSSWKSSSASVELQFGAPVSSSGGIPVF